MIVAYKGEQMVKKADLTAPIRIASGGEFGRWKVIFLASQDVMRNPFSCMRIYLFGLDIRWCRR
jgi:hypothetical protein